MSRAGSQTVSEMANDVVPAHNGPEGSDDENDHTSSTSSQKKTKRRSGANKRATAPGPFEASPIILTKKKKKRTDDSKDDSSTSMDDSVPMKKKKKRTDASHDDSSTSLDDNNKTKKKKKRTVDSQDDDQSDHMDVDEDHTTKDVSPTNDDDNDNDDEDKASDQIDEDDENNKRSEPDENKQDPDDQRNDEDTDTPSPASGSSKSKKRNPSSRSSRGGGSSADVEAKILSSISKFRTGTKSVTPLEIARLRELIDSVVHDPDHFGIDATLVERLENVLPKIGARKLSKIDAAAIRTAAPSTRSGNRMTGQRLPGHRLHDHSLPGPPFGSSTFVDRFTSSIPSAIPMIEYLLSSIQNIGTAGNGRGTVDFLIGLQTLADVINPDFLVISKPIFFADESVKSGHNYKGPIYENLAAISCLTKAKKPRRFILATATFPTIGIVTQTVEDRVATEWHSNLLLVVNGNLGSGKDLIVGEPNATDDDQYTMETDPRKVFEAPMARLLDSKSVREKKYRIWVNTMRTEENTEGICLRLVLEWMLELVVRGFPGTLDENGRVKVVLEKVRGQKPKSYLYRPLN